MTQVPSEHIFISYSRSDSETMRKIAFYLRDQGYRVWVDNEKLIPGTAAWEEAIERGINQAFAVVVILSPDSKNSEWVRREITYADQFGKTIFPILVRGAKEDALPLRLVTRQYVDFRKSEEGGKRALADALGFYIRKDHTMKMKRPLDITETVSARQSPASAPSQSKVFTKYWPIIAGGLFAICALTCLAAWAGYRILFPQPAETASLPTSEGLTQSPAPIASETFLPASTPQDTAIPSTPMPLADVVANYLNDVQTLDSDSFDAARTDKWNLMNGTVSNGVLTIAGTANYDGVFASRKFQAGQGVIIDFKHTPDTGMEIFLDSGFYGEPTYKRFGVYVEGSQIYVNEYGGNNKNGSGLTGSLVIQPETHYSILIAYLPSGELLEVIWDPADTSKTLVYREKMDASWQNLAMTFFVQAGSGTVQLDNYLAIQFSSAR